MRSDTRKLEAYATTLPFPPSVKRYWRHVGNRVLISGAYDNDRQIIRLTVEKFEPEKESPRSEILIRHVPAALGQPGYRICLRCDDEFDSLGPGNRFCRECTSWKNALHGIVKVVRGAKYHNGEVIS